ncbi:NAD(P)-dependent alcohol dehydrogenase [soil metagenome]
MRAVQLHGGRIDTLVVADGLPVPQPGPGQILLRVRAVSLNHRDLFAVSGRLASPVALPFVPGSDASGDVVALGAGVTQWRIGDRVMTVFVPGWQSGLPTLAQRAGTLGAPLLGVLQEYVCVAEGDAVRAPDGWRHEEAATLPIAALTAWSVLTAGGLHAGSTVLTQGTGGVALFALKFAKAAGATVIALSSREDKLARLRALGAAVCIDYRRTPDWTPAVRAATGGRGVDIVVETTGATLGQSVAATALGGFVGVVGFVGGMASDVPVRQLIGGLVRVQGMFVGPRDSFMQMVDALNANALRPVIDRVFNLHDSRAAFERLQGGAHVGKVVIALPDR